MCIFCVRIVCPYWTICSSPLCMCMSQAGSRIYQARRSVIPAPLGSIARPPEPAPPGAAPVGPPVLCPAQLAISALGKAPTASPPPAPEAHIAPVWVSLQQVKHQYLILCWRNIFIHLVLKVSLYPLLHVVEGLKSLFHSQQSNHIL